MLNEKGFILATVLAITLLVLILAGAAITMSELGYLAFGSEKKYQVADTAAEFALNSAVASVVATNVCPSANAGTLSTGNVTANYNYSSMTGGTTCFISAKGSFSGANVVKVVVVPVGINSAKYGALTLRNGGTLNLGGSATIVNCDSSCATPGLMYGGTVTTELGANAFHDTTICPNNPKGIYGGPEAVLNSSGQEPNCEDTRNCTFSSTTLPDLIPDMFNVDPSCRAANTCFAGLETLLTGAYGTSNPHNIDLTNLTVTDLPNTAPTVDSACTCSCNVTLSTATTTCCSGASQKNISACANVKVDGTLALSGVPSTTTAIVSTGNVSVTSATVDLTGKSLYATGSSGISVQNSTLNLTNSVINAGGGVSVQNSSFSGADNSHIIGGGDVSLQASGAITNSMIASTGSTSTVTIGGTGNVTGTNIVSKNGMTLDGSGDIRNSSLFSNTMTLQGNTVGQIDGTTLFSQGDMTVTGHITGNKQMGTDANPFLMLAGGNLTWSSDATGTVDLYGLMFTNSGFVNGAGGTFALHGAVTSNGTGSPTLQGNPSIIFDKTALTNLSTRLAGKAKPPSCGGGGPKKGYISSTKATIY